MPIYEYECKKCGHQTEVWQSFSDKPITRCELCNGRMKKLISQSTFHLKGSGWYVTDYASNRGRFEEKGEKSKKETSSMQSDGSTEKPKREAAPSGETSQKASSPSSGKDKND